MAISFWFGSGSVHLCAVFDDAGAGRPVCSRFPAEVGPVRLQVSGSHP
jgi:hypothetical protein